ncbi:SDR family oxidoreductase (plasmid) [Rhodococcus sp. USK10]|uniref:SDR family oxidoreductase n=1 Tax=Rhodococcus sp. USK10 TaxID=2789739 RepID=UPI001C5D2A5C|nr:SDR family oxidoreductase [Rhodococcus sp. USK10]
MNSVAPTNVNTPMIRNATVSQTFVGGKDNATEAEVSAALSPFHIFNEPWVEANDVSDAVVFLASEESRNLTGTVLPVDLGYLAKY